RCTDGNKSSLPFIARFGFKYRTPHHRAQALAAADKDVLGSDYKKRLESPIEQMKKLGIASQDLSLSLGDALKPAVGSLAATVLPYVRAANAWVKTHPQLISGIAKTVGGLLLFKGALLAVRLGLNLLGSPIRLLWGGFTRLRTGGLLLRTTFGMGGRLSRLAGSVGRLGKVLAGGLVTGLRLAGHALLWLGRALMFNPIGLTITAIAAGAYLIVRYIARGATATRTSAELWAQAAVTTQQSLGIAAKDFAAVQNIMAQGGKAGSFEIADQVKWLPELAPQMANVAQGKAAVAEMVAALQVAKMGAGSTDKAANNFNNFLEKLTAPSPRRRLYRTVPRVTS
ncbi:phage tail tape measure protein, partial [Sodalis-like symbiont of Philaenus spumarius]